MSDGDPSDGARVAACGTSSPHPLAASFELRSDGPAAATSSPSSATGTEALSEGSGSIEVRISTLGEGDEVPAHLRGMGCLSVADDGRGIESWRMPTIFQAFDWSKAAGSGLGLYTVLHLVDSLGGSLRLSSRVGSGATVDVLLPLASPAV